MILHIADEVGIRAVNDGNASSSNLAVNGSQLPLHNSGEGEGGNGSTGW